MAAVVGLTLLEVIRDQDLPTEILESEDPSVTLPRRLGLSEVIDRQIRRYREEVRKGHRITDEEVTDLVRLVIRRPDSEEVFFRVGELLAGDLDGGRSGWRRLLPRALAYAGARRTVGRRLRKLFGRRVGGFAPGPFTIEGRALIFIQSDPGGDACQFLSGLCQAVLRNKIDGDVRVVHSLCQAHGDQICRWTVMAEEKVRAEASVGDFMLSPEPGSG